MSSSTNTFITLKAILKDTYGKKLCKTCKKAKKDCTCGK